MARCLVCGAYGFIGRYLVGALQAEGFEVVGAGRDLELGRRLLPDIAWIEVDFNRHDRSDVWLPRLGGIDAVVNCAGVLQSTFRDDADRIHRRGTIALFKACAAAGVRRLIHISAMSAERDVATAYAASKAAADEALAKLDCNWLIVKPSLVIGPGSFGGTSMIRALAGFPLVTPLPAADGGQAGGQEFQPIAMSYLVTGLARLAKGDAPSRTTLSATGPETLTLREVVALHRRWLGFPPARKVALPRALIRPALWIGDALGYIGSPSAMRSTSLAQMDQMGHTDPAPFAQATGLKLRPLATALTDRPATLQDRMHARSVFALAVTQGAIALFWIMTGLIALMPGANAEATVILQQAGVTQGLAAALVYAGAMADVIAGALFISAQWLRRAGLMQLALSAVYLAGGTMLRPDLWADPLGPLVKVVPIMAATLLVMALAEKR